jgi:di/tricarboxylate transporter
LPFAGSEAEASATRDPACRAQGLLSLGIRTRGIPGTAARYRHRHKEMAELRVSCHDSPVEMVLVIALLVLALVLLTTERLPVELVSLLVLGTLLVMGVAGAAGGWLRPDKWITPEEALSGFSNTAVVTVAAMFVLSAGLERTGAMAAVGRVLAGIGRSPTVLLLVVMVVVGAVSAFVNNTATVAVFLPLVLMVCARRRLPASRVLIPLSFASQFGGVCTLIGTSTNLLVSSISERAGLEAFRMFEFTPFGVILLAVGTVYLLIASRWLPTRRGTELTEAYKLREYLTEVRVMPGSPLVGKTVAESRLKEQHDVAVLEILRDPQHIWTPDDAQLRAGDILLVRGQVQDLMDVRARTGLEIESEFKLRDATLAQQDLTLVEALVAPRSQLAGQTLASAEFRWRYDAIVLALQRQGRLLREKLVDVRLRFGDALLLLLRKDDLSALRRNDNLIVLSEVDTPSLRSGKTLMALGIIGAVVTLAAIRVAPIFVCAIVGGLLMVLARCLTLEQAFQAIDWKVIFLLAGVLPLGMALDRSGGARLIADYTLGLISAFGPVVVLAALYLLTALLTEMMSNNAAAVLLAPIAISTAAKLGVDPKPMLMAVAFAASTSFATPVGYQTNTMVHSAGGYRFTDFTKIGVPLILIFWALSVWFIPKFWPF